MELTYDWRSFQEVFYPHRRAGNLSQSSPAAPVYLVLDGDTIVSALAEHEDLTDWVGASFREVSAQAPHREYIPFNQKDVDRWVGEGFGLASFYDQVEYYRAQLKPGSRAANQVEARRHFLLDGVLGWWGKVLPSSYGVYLRVEGQHEKNLLLLVRRGAVEGFHVPDLASMGVDRARQPADVVKYLSEKYLVPVQGLFITAADWAEWTQNPNPWRLVAKSVRQNRAKLVPFRWSIAVLMATRAFLGV